MWTSRMTADLHAEIIAIKRAVCAVPQYRKNLLSVHVYEAVLEYGIRGLDAFWQRWAARYGQG